MSKSFFFKSFYPNVLGMACRAGVKYLPCSTTLFTASLHTHDQIQVDEVDDASRENKTYIQYLCWTYDCISKVRRKLPPKPSYLECLWTYDIYWYILSDGQETNVSLGPQKVKTRTKSIFSTCSIYKFHQISLVLSHLPSAALILMRFGLHQGTDPWCSRLKRKWCKERSPNLNHCHCCTPHLPVHVGGTGHIHCQAVSKGIQNL